MLYTQRVFWPQYKDAEKLDRLLAFLQNHAEISREISFFTEGDGMDWRYLQVEEIDKRAEFLTYAVKRTREAGFIPVINILNTLGHSDEGGEAAPRLPWQEMVCYTGAASAHCSCPADPTFLEYVKYKYKRFAEAGATKYWIDDDIRFNAHHPVKWGCFCPLCLSDFNDRQGAGYSREELVAGFKRDQGLRKAWIQRNSEVMQHLLNACVEGINEGHPGAEYGFMVCDMTWLLDAQVNFKSWFEGMGSIHKGQAWLRPGGGFWNDERPKDLLSKLYSVQKSISALPKEVKSAYEVENYPYTLGSKSVQMTALECLLVTLTADLDGIMFNMLDLAGNSLATYDDSFSRLELDHPRWEQVSLLVKNSKSIGWSLPYSLKHFENYSYQDEAVTEIREMLYPKYQIPLVLQQAGLPFTGSSVGDDKSPFIGGNIVSGQVARGMSRDEIEQLLRFPLILDGEAAQIYIAQGLGARIGVENLQAYSAGVFERFTDHPLNGEAAGYIRAVTLAYFNLQSFAIQPLPQTQVLSKLLNPAYDELGAALTLYHPEGGEPVAVVGHLPWNHVLSPQRMLQMSQLSAYMLTERVPFKLKSLCPIVFWFRFDTTSQNHLIILFNPSFDPAANVEVYPSDGIGGKASLVYATDPIILRETEKKCVLHLPAWAVAVLCFSN